MSDDDKPFACSALGCGMRFSTEDHLNVHIRKHEMSLALNLGGGGLIASPSNPFLDQTPTPTKFLRNCEEIGLFQELSKNPFEEAFKKAADLPEGVPLPGPHSNDLNTPVPPDPSRLDSVIEVPKLTSSLSIKEEVDKESGVIAIEETEALDLSGRRQDAKQAIPQPSSTTSDEDVNVRSTSQAADSTMSPAKPMVSSSSSETVSPAPVNMSNVAVVQSGAGLPTTSASAAQQVYTMQVYLQLPSGQTVPVNIPATIGPVGQQQQQQQQQQQPPSPQGIVIQQKAPSAGTLPTTPVTTAPVTTPTSSMVLKQRLKQTIQQNTPSLAVIKTEPAPLPTLHTSVSPSQPSTSLYIPDTVSGSQSDSPVGSPDGEFSESGFNIKRSKRTSVDDDADERRRKFLERNRAAAARCRQKRKHWINNLEKKADELQNTNSRLQSEVSLLRGEVAQLKTLLLAHKDCPITLQQKSQGHLALTTINLVESGASASIPTITSSEVSASQVAGATEAITMASGITVIPVSAEHIVASQEVGKK